MINSYNELINSSRKVCYLKDKKYYHEFYLNLAFFSLQLLLLKENIAYSGAFKGTQIIAKHLKFRYLSEIGGPVAPKVLMSVTHWEIRGKIWEFVDLVKDPSKIYEVLNPENYKSEWFVEYLKKAEKEEMKELAEMVRSKDNIDDVLNEIDKQLNYKKVIEKNKQIEKKFSSKIQNWYSYH